MVRIGIGYDSHRLVPDRPLLLGSVTIPFDRGLLGHSDGDVVLHAVTDALLGAAALPDIGELFPDTDPAYQDADSAQLLRQALAKLAAKGYHPHNVDVVIHAERPKLSAHKIAMRTAMAALLGIDVDDVNVKAKTAEGLGDIGAGNAIACTAVATITRR